MKFYYIKKKHLILFVSVLFLFVLLFTFYKIDASSYTANCSDNLVFSVSSLETLDTSMVTNLQTKIDALYQGDEKIVFLTFDDGPTKLATPKVLDILKKENVHASFFVIGYRVEEFPAIVKRAYEEGHFIANHGYSHQNTKLYQSREAFIEEIEKTDECIASALGVSSYHSQIFRFPNRF